MAIDDSYLSLPEFKARLNIDLADTANDAVYAQALLAASRQIDRATGRNFNQTEPIPRHITAGSYGTLLVRDLVSVTEIATDAGDRTYSTIWGITDYDLWPYDAAEAFQPYSQIRVAPGGAQGFPVGAQGVRVTGVWGFPQVPQVVIECTALLANRIKSLWNAPFGATGAGELGAGLNMTAAATPLIREMLAPFKAAAVF